METIADGVYLTIFVGNLPQLWLSIWLSSRCGHPVSLCVRRLLSAAGLYK